MRDGPRREKSGAEKEKPTIDWGDVVFDVDLLKSQEINLDQVDDKASVIDAFFIFAQAEQQREAQELVADENLNGKEAKRYITVSLEQEFASDNGTELNAVPPKMSPLRCDARRSMRVNAD